MDPIEPGRRGFLQGLGVAALAGLVGPLPWAHAEEVPPGSLALHHNENPLGPSPRAMAALRAELDQVHRYPDFTGDALRQALAEHHGVTPEHVVLGNGSTEVLQQAALALLGPDAPLVTAEPDFVVPERLAARLGAEHRRVPVDPAGRLDLAAMLDRAEGAGLLYLCNPLNPLGTLVPAAALADAVAAAPCPVLVDEAYHELVLAPGHASAIELVRRGEPGVVVTRTFSKAHGLAGLRLGYGVAHPDLAATLRAWATPVGRNRLALAAATAALGDAAHVAETRRVLADGLAPTRLGLRRLGYPSVPTQAPFLAFRVPDPIAVAEHLEARGVLVGATTATPGSAYLNHLRVSLGTRAHMRRFLEALGSFRA